MSRLGLAKLNVVGETVPRIIFPQMEIDTMEKNGKTRNVKSLRRHREPKRVRDYYESVVELQVVLYWKSGSKFERLICRHNDLHEDEIAKQQCQ